MGKKNLAWESFWNDVAPISATGFDIVQTDDQLRLEEAITNFQATNPLSAQIIEVADLIRFAYNIGKIAQYRKPNQSMKGAALELMHPFESAKKEENGPT